MKKLTVSAVLVLLAGAATLQAQKNKVSFGVRGGVNLANIIKTDNSNYATEIKPGFNAAAFVDIPVVHGLTFQPELQFSQKGYKNSGSYLGNNYSYTTTTNFVEVPLLAKFSPSPGFGIVVGPQFSFLTSTVYKFKDNNSAYQKVIDNKNNNLRNNIVGGVIGLEAGLDKLIFSARYSLDFQKNNGDGTSNTPKYRNQVVGLSVGVRL
ncbi:MAG: porin family protein [Chitinophagaceae bacterium]